MSTSTNTSTSSQTHSTSVPPTGSARGRRRRGGRSTVDRERHMNAWRERRQAAQGFVSQDARLRLRLHGRVEAVRDAAAALAHPSAEPWQSEREQLNAAALSGSEQAVVAAARSGARKAAGDATRGGLHAPDADMAIAAATAYKVIQFAPRCLLALHDRERPRPARPAAVSAFWR
jgi:hypothetical protein